MAGNELHVRPKYYNLVEILYFIGKAGLPTNFGSPSSEQKMFQAEQLKSRWRTK